MAKGSKGLFLEKKNIFPIERNVILDFSSTCQVDSVVWLLSFLFRLAKLYKIKRGHVRRHRLLRLPVVGLFFFFFTLVLPLSLFSFSLSLVLSVCECVCVTLNGSTGTSSLGALLSARMRFQISCPPLQPGPASFLFFYSTPPPTHTERQRQTNEQNGPCQQQQQQLFPF